MRHRLLSNIVSVSMWLICVYAFVSTDGSLPKEAKGDGSSQIAGETHPYTHSSNAVFLLCVCVLR